MSRKYLIIHAIICGLLLTLPYYSHFSGLFLCIALVPLLLIEDLGKTKSSAKSNLIILFYASTSFLVWNIGTTWWIVKASLAGACAAIVINTFLMSAVFYFYHVTRKVVGNRMGKIAFVTYWATFEYFYLNAEISWPWLNLGNGFANNVNWVQWYEYTGTLGGTIWILIVNLLFFELVRNIQIGNTLRKLTMQLIPIGFVLCLPIVFSIWTYHTYHEKNNPADIIVLQPNIDPYNNTITSGKLCSNLIHIADSCGAASVTYFVAPEVAINDNVWENSMENNYSMASIRNFIRHHPASQFVLGAYTYKRFGDNEPRTATAQWMKSHDFYFDSYNAALQIDSGKLIQKYHKSKLVVGIEKMPYPKTLKFLRKIVETLGGSFASHGTQDFRGVFVSTDKKFTIAPVICYESIYGEFVTEYVENGANLIFIITNDGWWGNTPGYRQHLAYAKLRAIETRRSIARSANTGISAFINQRGDIIKSLEYGKRGTLECSLNANDKKTFYVTHGDYLGKIASLISACIALYTIVLIIYRRKV